MSEAPKRRKRHTEKYFDAIESFSIMTVDGNVSDKEALESIAVSYGFEVALEVAEQVKSDKNDEKKQ